MKQSKDKKPAAADTDAIDAVVVEAAPAKKNESVVDDVFDAVTAWAAQGLTAAKRGLEASARWLDGRARVVGELATKLAAAPRQGESA